MTDPSSSRGPSPDPGGEREHVFDRPENVRRLLRFFYVACGALLLADFVIHRHVAHPLEAMWGFYALYGFVACVALVLIAKEMRKVVMRDEHYYERDGE